MEDEYEKVREEAVKEVEKEDDSASCSVEDQEDTKQEEAEKTERPPKKPEKTEKEKKPEKTEKEKKPEKPKKPRWTCPDCGKSLSVTTKKGRHKCYVLPKEPAAPAAPDRVASPPVPSSDPEPAPRQVTLDDVTHFLWANQQEQSRIRRERLMAQMF